MKGVFAFILSILIGVGCLSLTAFASSPCSGPAGSWDRAKNKPSSFDEEQKLYIDRNVKSTDYAHLLQTDSRWCWAYLLGHTIGKWGCNLTCSTMFCMMADPTLRNVEEWGPDYAYHEGYLDANSVPTSKAPIEVVGGVNLRGLSQSEIDKKICEQLAKGYYVTIQAECASITGLHFVPVLGESNGVPVVWDVSFARDTYPATDKSSPLKELQYITMYKAKSGYEGYDKDVADRLISDSSDISRSLYENGYGGLVSEWELTGMPSPSVLFDEQGNIVLPDNTGLSEKEKDIIGHIKDNMSAGKTTFSQILHTVFTVIGLLLMVYAVLLWLSFIFDRVNVFFDFSLVYFLSFGRLRVIANPEKGDIVPQGYITNKVFFIKTAVIFAIGALLVSGLLIRLVEQAISLTGG